MHDYVERLTTLEQRSVESVITGAHDTTQASHSLTAEINAIRTESRESMLLSNGNEQYSRRNNLRIHGIQPDSDCRLLAVNFIKSVLTVPRIEEKDIEIANSAYGPQSTYGNDQTSTSQPARRPVILVRFYQRDHRDMVIRARKILKGTRYAVTEDLTSLNVKTMNRLKNGDMVRKTWCWNGSIFAILSNNKKVVVRPFQSIYDLMND